MRKSYLREQIDNYCRQNHNGSYRARKHRYYVLHKMIRDLFHLGCVPPKWHALTREQLQGLVLYWQKKKIKPSTIMKYLTVIREFLQKIEHQLPNINNQNLGVYNLKKPLKTVLEPDFDSISNQIAKLLLELQIHLGLTLSEAMRLTPDIHIQDNAILLTREISTNSRDRMIPLRSNRQLEVLNDFRLLCKGTNLIISHGYHPLRYAYTTELKAKNLPSAKSYRYLYAKTMYQELCKIISPYLAKQTIIREMGLQSRRTLWSYLNEQY